MGNLAGTSWRAAAGMVGLLMAVAVPLSRAQQPASATSATSAAATTKQWTSAASKPAAQDNVSYWLAQAKPASAPASTAATAGTAAALTPPPVNRDRPAREDALPGVIELSDGKLLPGWLYTTMERPWVLWVESEKRWRNIPFIDVLSITAVVEEEKVEQEWRWREMGAPERVYSGKEYPTRKLQWKFHLIDGSSITGVIKGQPIWVEMGTTKAGPMVLHERQKGEMDQKMADLLYIKRIVVSKKAMESVLREAPGD